MNRRLLTQRLVALALVGWFVFDFAPLRRLATDATLFGWPLVPALFFVAWALLIAALAWLMERAAGDDDEEGGPRR